MLFYKNTNSAKPLYSWIREMKRRANARNFLKDYPSAIGLCRIFQVLPTYTQLFHINPAC